MVIDDRAPAAPHPGQSKIDDIAMSQPATPLFVPQRFVPTREQCDIQLSRHRVTLIEANAGAAKTTTLALRIGEALARGLAPERILALTFTPEARDVMRARLIEVGIASGIASRIWVTTMEDLAHDVLKGIEDAVPPKRPSSRQLRETALEALENVSLAYQDLEASLDIRTHNVAVSQFLDALLRLKARMAFESVDDAPGLEFVAEDLGVTLTTYLWSLEYEKLRRGLFAEVSFRGPFDATYDLAKLLREEPESAERLPDVALITADELHDLNEASFSVLEALYRRADVYFVGAGDRDQVIHTQVGADAQFLMQRFAYASRYPLTLTYRHGPHLAYAMRELKNKPVDSALSSRTDIELLTYPDAQASECANRVVQAVQAWQSRKKPLDGCAILLRERHQSVEIENALMQANIGYRTGSMTSYLLREEILFLRGMLAIALDNLEAVRSASVRGAIVEALAVFGEVPLEPKEIDEAKQTIARHPEMLRDFFVGQITRVGNQAVSARITAAVQSVRSAPPETPAYEALRTVCTLLDVEALAHRVYIDPHEAAIITYSIDGFVAMAQRSAMSLRDFHDWLGAADEFVSSRRSRNLVLIEYAAHSKGKEYDHVLIPFMAAGEFPSAIHDPRDEENLFYVAATRARSRLTLIAPAGEDRRSPFIARMRLTQTEAYADAVLRQEPRREAVSRARRDLSVPYADKDIAKALGAKWDAVRKVWYVLPDQDIGPFAPWLPKQ